MKKTILVFALILTMGNSYSQTNIYHPFPDSNTIWIGTDKSFDGINCYIYNDYNLYISGDTTIGLYTYHKLHRDGFMYSNCPPPGYFYYDQYYGAFRQDVINKKVFLNFGDGDTLAYDFNLNVGDTLPPTYFNWYASNNYVSSIDSVFVESEYRKRFWISNSYSNPNFIALIEGIGSDHGAFAYIGENWMEASSDLWCVYNEDEVIWQIDPTGYGCNLISSVYEQIPKNEITIYPNPFNSFTKIRIPENYTNVKIYMYNSFGQIIKEIKSTFEKSIRIERGNLESGLYFIQIVQNNNHTLTKKIMIQD